MESYQVRQCKHPSCGLRYPTASAGPASGLLCPACRGETILIYSHALEREAFAGSRPGALHLEALLDNIRSAWNVGAMLRTADGLGIRHVYLGGLTPPGDNPKVIKTALGAEQNVAWSVHRNGFELVQELISQGKRVWALEQAPGSVSIAEMLPDHSSPIVLVVGNEIGGVDVDILALCERIIHLPMRGAKRSYNAAVAFGMAASWLAFKE